MQANPKKKEEACLKSACRHYFFMLTIPIASSLIKLEVQRFFFSQGLVWVLIKNGVKLAGFKCPWGPWKFSSLQL